MPKIDLDAAPRRDGTGYPPPFDALCAERKRRKLGDAAGLDQFGVNLLRLPAGQWSSQRHWHAGEDEFVWVLDGEVVLVEENGETVLRAGDCAGFKAGVADGHHLQNRSGVDALLLEIGSRAPAGDSVTYPDIDLALDAGRSRYRHLNGEDY